MYQRCSRLNTHVYFDDFPGHYENDYENVKLVSLTIKFKFSNLKHKKDNIHSVRWKIKEMTGTTLQIPDNSIVSAFLCTLYGQLFTAV